MSPISDLIRFFDTDGTPGSALLASYDPVLVTVSFFVAALAGFAFVHLSHRLAEQDGSTLHQIWMWGGALTMGFGVWAMHFVGMLAYRLPIAVSYDPLITLISAVPAVLASAWSLQIVARSHITRLRLVLGGIVLGSGIGTMHYTGMAAMDFNAVIRYDPALFALSILVAVLLAIAALWVAFQVSQRGRRANIAVEILSAALIGLAVSGMHYTAMSSTVCFSTGNQSWLPLGPDAEILAAGTAIVATLVLIAAIAAVLFDRRLESEVYHRRQAIDQALASDRRLQLIMDNVNDAVLTLDESGNIETINRAGERIFGFKAREAVGLNISYMLSNLNANQDRAGLLAYFDDPSIRSGSGFEIIGRRKDGSRLFLEAVLTDVKQDGRTVVIAAFRDITERMVNAAALARAKEEAEKASQAKSEFMSHMSHELRTPLNAIIGLSDLLLQAKELRTDQARLADYLGDIRASGRHLLNLVNEILDVSMIESGQRAIVNETFDVVAEVEDLIRPLKRSLIGGKAAIEVAELAAPIYISADRQSFNQVILNLATNALTHGGDNVRVNIEVEGLESDDFACIRITDDGPGMAPEIIQAIGQPVLHTEDAYVRNNADAREATAGLGLYIVNQLMTLNSGRLAIESAPGRGTVAATYWCKAREAAE